MATRKCSACDQSYSADLQQCPHCAKAAASSGRLKAAAANGSAAPAGAQAADPDSDILWSALNASSPELPEIPEPAGAAAKRNGTPAARPADTSGLNLGDAAGRSGSLASDLRLVSSALEGADSIVNLDAEPSRPDSKRKIAEFQDALDRSGVNLHGSHRPPSDEASGLQLIKDLLRADGPDGSQINLDDSLSRPDASSSIEPGSIGSASSAVSLGGKLERSSSRDLIAEAVESGVDSGPTSPPPTPGRKTVKTQPAVDLDWEADSVDLGGAHGDPNSASMAGIHRRGRPDSKGSGSRVGMEGVRRDSPSSLAMTSDSASPARRRPAPTWLVNGGIGAGCGVAACLVLWFAGVEPPASWRGGNATQPASSGQLAVAETRVAGTEATPSSSPAISPAANEAESKLAEQVREKLAANGYVDAEKKTDAGPAIDQLLRDVKQAKQTTASLKADAEKARAEVAAGLEQLQAAKKTADARAAKLQSDAASASKLAAEQRELVAFAESKLKAAESKANEAEARSRETDDKLKAAAEKLASAGVTEADLVKGIDALAAARKLLETEVARSNRIAETKHYYQPTPPSAAPAFDGVAAEQHYAAGLRLLHEGQAADAEKALAQAVAGSDRDARFYYYLGIAQLAQGKEDAAIENFQLGARQEEQSRPSRTVVNYSMERVQGEMRRIINQYRP